MRRDRACVGTRGRHDMAGVGRARCSACVPVPGPRGSVWTLRGTPGVLAPGARHAWVVGSCVCARRGSPRGVTGCACKLSRTRRGARDVRARNAGGSGC